MPTPFIIQLQYDDQSVTPKSEKMTFYDTLYTDVNSEDLPLGQRVRLTIHPKEDIVLKNLQIDLAQNYGASDQIFCNGYQSWTESKMYLPSEQIPDLKWPARNKWKQQGDYERSRIKRGTGQLHSWTYTFIKRAKQVFFCGSLNEHTGFTIFQHDCQSGKLSIQLDLETLKLSHSYPAFDLVILEGKEEAVFKAYFEQLDLPELKAPPLTGWTSWYHYYQDINEDLLDKNLQALAAQETKVDLFQIDDGYQPAVGDWLKTTAGFPNGMSSIARKINSHGMKAGLWLAPFICDSRSDIFKNKPGGILKDAAGQMVKAGYSKGWGGWYYALDFYEKEVQDYLTGVFFHIFNKWGYQLVKLDFLYAACLAPPSNKTSGQVMCEAMNFLRRLAGDKWILACGVPLGAAFGRVDYCRIGGDVRMSWEDKWLRWSGLRERTSTLASLHSTLNRWQLNGHAFHNDPDVFVLRETKNKLTHTEQITLLLANRLLGNILMTSDFVGDYSPEQWCEFTEIFQSPYIRVNQVVFLGSEQYSIQFVHQKVKWIAYLNLSNKPMIVTHQSHQITIVKHNNLILKN